MVIIMLRLLLSFISIIIYYRVLDASVGASKETSIGTYVYIYVYMYICICACIHVFMSMSVNLCMYIYMYICMSINVCVYTNVYIFMSYKNYGKTKETSIGTYVYIYT
jgi:hypothetical protein